NDLSLLPESQPPPADRQAAYEPRATVNTKSISLHKSHTHPGFFQAFTDGALPGCLADFLSAAGECPLPGITSALQEDSGVRVDDEEITGRYERVRGRRVGVPVVFGASHESSQLPSFGCHGSAVFQTPSKLSRCRRTGTRTRTASCCEAVGKPV